MWSVLLYGCECREITKDNERRIEAAEIWFLRRMLNIQWKDKISNEKVLKQYGLKRSLMKTIRKRQLVFFSHIHRKDSVEKIAASSRYITSIFTETRAIIDF